MKRLASIFICFLSLFPKIACADYALIKNENLSQIFQKSDNSTSWVESTDRNRAIVWYCAVLDIQAYDPTYDAKDNGKPVFFIGKDNSYNFIHLYIRDMDDNFKHITMCPSWGYIIYEEVGVSQKTAKETLSKLTKAQFEMTFEEIVAVLNSENATEASQTEAPTSSNESQDSKKDEKTVADLPSLSGTFSGETVKVKVNGKTYTIRKDFKIAMDKYSEYFDSYITLAQSLSVNDPNYLTQYAALMEKYLEVVQALEYLDEIDNDNLTKDEAAYLLYVTTDINTKLLSVMGN